MPQEADIALVANPKALKRLDELLRLRITGGRGISVRETTEAVIISATAQRPVVVAGGAGPGCYRYKSQGASGDFIVCRAWDGENEGDDDIKIAKPWLLRRTPFDAQTYNGVSYAYTSATEREADDGSTTETQLVTQDYALDDLIFAVPAPTQVVDPDADNAPVTLLDLNVDARAWAKEGA